MRSFITLFLSALALHSFGQYPFEKFPALQYKTYKSWKVFRQDEKQTEYILTIPKFFDRKDSLTLLLTAIESKWDSSFITVLRNGKEVQRFFEPMFFIDANLMEEVMTADVNGDKLQDIKLVVPYMSNGLGVNTRVIYLFQQAKKNFTKISFKDEMFGQNREERDLNNDGSYEIITMTLTGYQAHSYWVYNLFNYKNNDLVSVDYKYNYPILIQFLYKSNFKITNKMSRQKMKEFAQAKPEEYDRR